MPSSGLFHCYISRILFQLSGRETREIDLSSLTKLEHDFLIVLKIFVTVLQVVISCGPQIGR